MRPLLNRRTFVSTTAAAAALPLAGRVSAQVTRVEVPFQLRENQPLTQMTINGAGPYWFLIDTGASGFAVDDLLARELRLRVVGQGRSQGAVGRTQTLNIYQANEIFVAGGLRDRNVLLGGLTALRGQRFRGVFPMTRNAAEIGMDFDRSKFIVDTRPPNDHPGFDRLAIRVDTRRSVRANRPSVDPSPRVQVRIAGRPATLILDTGASGAVFLKPDFVRRHDLFATATRYRDGASMGVAGPFRTRLTPIESLEIGRYRFDDLPVSLGYPEDSGRDGWGDYDGLLGVEVLRRLNFFIKPPRDELWIRPNSHLKDVYRFNRSGLNLDWRDDRVVVTGVSAGSPGARAGLKPGDVITSAPGGSYVGLVWVLTGASGTAVPMAVVSDGGASRDVVVTLDDGFDD